MPFAVSCGLVAVHVPLVHESSIASLTRRQANAVEFATKVCLSLFDGLELIAQLTSGTKGNCATCSASETYDLLSVQIYIEAKATCQKLLCTMTAT